MQRVMFVASLMVLVGSASAIAQSGDASPSAGAAVPSAMPSVGAAELPPNGVWQSTVTAGELLAAGAPDARFAGTQTWTLLDGTGKLRIDLADGGFTECTASYAVVGDIARFTFTSGTDCVPVVDDIRWTLDDAGMHVTLVASQWSEPGEDRAEWESHPWVLMGDALPSAGSSPSPGVGAVENG
jgi:hypothetical protein